MAPYFDAMLAGFERVDPDFDINVGNLPYCIIPQWGARIHHGGEETVTSRPTPSASRTRSTSTSGTRRCAAPPGCADCVFRPRCTGIFRTYLDLYGGEEFTPVRARHCSALDPSAATSS